MTALGIVVLVVGAILLAVEAHVSTAGIVGSTAAAALIAGAALTVVGAGGGAGLAVAAAGGTALFAGGGMLVVARRTAAARKALPRGGASGLLGRVATVRSWHGDQGRVFVDGALWRACDEYDASVDAGDAVVVDGVRGLTLTVRKADPWELHR